MDTKRVQEPGHQLCSHKQLGQLVMSSFILLFFPPFRPPTCPFSLIPPRFTPSFLLLLPPSSAHHLSLLALDAHSHHTSLIFYDSLISFRWINPKIYCLAGVVYNCATPEKNKTKQHISLRLLTVLTRSAGWSFFGMQAIRCLHVCEKPKLFVLFTRSGRPNKHTVLAVYQKFALQ